jgi:hypothetical protein
MSIAHRQHKDHDEAPIDRVLARLSGVQKNGSGYVARCPVPGHGKGRGDQNPSLSVGEKPDGVVWLKCHAGCTRDEVLEAAGLTWEDLYPASRNGHTKATGEWHIKNAEGETVAIHLRFDEPDGKEMPWKLPGRDGWGLKGTKPSDLPLYGSELLKDYPPDVPIIVTEGEKAADALLAAHIPAVGTVTGAAWTPSADALEVLRDRSAILWPDADEPGWLHMQRIAAKLHNVAREIRVYEWPDAPEGGDAADHPAVTGGATKYIRVLLDDSPVWEPPEREEKPGISGIFSAADLMAEEMPEVRWAVPDILPEGVTLLAGKPKLGKSWMALGLAIATATGGVALGTKRVEKGEVLYLALEDNKRRLQNRIRKLLAGRTAPAGLHIATDWPRANEGGCERLDAFLTDHPDTRLVVIDTLARIKPRTFGRRTQYDEDRDAVDPLIPIAAEHGVAILLVHHLREAESDDPLDMIHGSAGLTGGVDGALVLKRQRGRADAYLHVEGRDIENPTELALKFDHNAATWAIVGNAEEYRMSETRAAILGVIDDADGPLGPKEITAILNSQGFKIEYGTVRERLSQMAKDGQVERVGIGSYVRKQHDSHDTMTKGKEADEDLLF